MTRDDIVRMAQEAAIMPPNWGATENQWRSLEAFAKLVAQAELVKRAEEAFERSEQPTKQEPVVWMYQDKTSHAVKFQKEMAGFVDHGQTYETPLYATPFQRKWIGLTYAEFDEVTQGLLDFEDCWLFIEAKLKEKNA